MTDLKPCPFCGSTDVKIFKAADPGYFAEPESWHYPLPDLSTMVCVMCRCGAGFFEFSTKLANETREKKIKDALANEWNRRTLCQD